MRSYIALASIFVFGFGTFVAAQPGGAPRRFVPSANARPIASARPIANASAKTGVVGTLRKNPQARREDPPFALLDAQGRVAYYVTPQPGLRLDAMVGRRVKLEGSTSPIAGKSVQRLEAFAVTPAAKLASEEIQNAITDNNSDIATVQFEEELPEATMLDPVEATRDETYYEGPEEGTDIAAQVEQLQTGPRGGVFHAHDGCQSCGGWGCNHCGAANGCLSGWYGRIEAIYWWTDGMFTPALVTTSPPGTTRANAGVLGVPGTSILFGNTGLNNDGRFGGRVSMGYYINRACGAAIEGDYFSLGDANDNFNASSPGNPILARPFYDILQGTESSELVAFPNVLSGSVDVQSSTRFSGGGIRGRWNLCGCDDCDPCNGCSWRTGVTAGYRHYYLADSLQVTETLVSTDTANPGNFLVRDNFNTYNNFDGFEIGGIMEGRNGRWSWELLSRTAIGNTNSKVDIAGFTDATQNGVTTRGTGGLLAQRTNIGSYERDAFAIAPQLEATLGLQLTSVWRVTFGYTFIYWSNVVRAGQQIDRDINTNLLPPETVPFAGPLRPAFAFNDTDFWAQGINLGLDARW